MGIELHYAEDDIVWSRAVKERFDGVCCYPGCGSTFGCGSHHVFRRGIQATRLVIENGLYLCVECHMQLHRLSGVRKPIETLLVGKKTFQALEKLVNDRIEQLVEIGDIPSSRDIQEL